MMTSDKKISQLSLAFKIQIANFIMEKFPRQESRKELSVDCKTVVFGCFPFSLTVFTLAPDLSFEDGPSLSLAFARNTTALHSKLSDENNRKVTDV